LSNTNKLECSAAGRTKMCCDSPISKKLTVMLPQVTTYNIENNVLRLNVPEWGWINLERISD